MGCLTLKITDCTRCDLIIEAALVCRIGSNKWEYFDVADGPFIVEDGYLKVKKEE